MGLLAYRVPGLYLGDEATGNSHSADAFTRGPLQIGIHSAKKTARKSRLDSMKRVGNQAGQLVAEFRHSPPSIHFGPYDCALLKTTDTFSRSATSFW